MSNQFSNFAPKFGMMKKNILFILLAVVLVSSCGSKAKVAMSTDYDQRYEAAKQAYVEGHYSRCSNLLADMIVVMKGTDKAQESLYMMAMAQYNLGDYETAATYLSSFIPAILRVISVNWLAIIQEKHSTIAHLILGWTSLQRQRLYLSYRPSWISVLVRSTVIVRRI
jgi:hypothetical protein